MAMAVISSPEAMPGQPPGRLFLGAVLDEVGGGDVVVEGHTKAGTAGPGRLRQLLGDHRVEAEVDRAHRHPARSGTAMPTNPCLPAEA